MRISLFILCFIGCVHSIAQQQDVIVISEIMSDPSPVVGLPAVEWIELTNVSNTVVNLQHWRLGDINGLSGPMNTFNLLPDSSVTICSATSLPLLAPFGNCLSVTSFPSLDNNGELIYLANSSGRTAHAVHYSADWYGNDLKKEGGWTLEIIDPANRCQGKENWTASVSLTGGTPGRKNSVFRTNPDSFRPHIVNSYPTGPNSVVIVFDEQVDSLAAVSFDYRIDHQQIITGLICEPHLFDRVTLLLSQSLVQDTIYTIHVRNINDCAGNISPIDSIRTGISSEPEIGDLIINEVLFNPKPGASDFVELYNTSGKIVDASKMFIANRTVNGLISGIRPMSIDPFHIFPREYVAITEEPSQLSQFYFVKDSARVRLVRPMPSFPDNEGCVIVLNASGLLIDELRYTEKWHFGLLSDREGISLERIDPRGNTNNPHNWHSASGTAGFATPGYTNSQFRVVPPSRVKMELSPRVFSPDNDGRDDFTVINYVMESPGFVANLRIFDQNGRLVRHLVKSELLGVEGKWTWDGLDDKRLPLRSGPYVLHLDLFKLNGGRDEAKTTVYLSD